MVAKCGRRFIYQSGLASLYFTSEALPSPSTRSASNLQDIVDTTSRNRGQTLATCASPVPVPFLLYKFELKSMSLLSPQASPSPGLCNSYSMVNIRTFTSVAYLSQFAFLGGNAQTNSSQLRDIVPKREVLYVGGKYTNITASLDEFC